MHVKNDPDRFADFGVTSRHAVPKSRMKLSFRSRPGLTSNPGKSRRIYFAWTICTMDEGPLGNLTLWKPTTPYIRWFCSKIQNPQSEQGGPWYSSEFGGYVDRNKHLKRCICCEMRNFGFLKLIFHEFCSIFWHISHELNILRTWGWCNSNCKTMENTCAKNQRVPRTTCWETKDYYLKIGKVRFSRRGKLKLRESEDMIWLYWKICTSLFSRGYNGGFQYMEDEKTFILLLNSHQFLTIF